MPSMPSWAPGRTLYQKADDTKFKGVRREKKD